MALSQINSDLHVLGQISAVTINLPANTVDNSATDDANFSDQFPVRYGQANGADVAAETQAVHIVRGAASTIVAVEAQVQTAPTGGDKAFTVDVQYSNDGAAYATVLSSTISFSNSDADRDIKTGTLSTTALDDGDSLEVIIATSGTTGSQGQGLVVTIWLKEDRQP